MKSISTVNIERCLIGNVTLAKNDCLQEFALQNTKLLTSLLHSLARLHQQMDSSCREDLLELASDLSYQVHQAVSLLNIERTQVVAA